MKSIPLRESAKLKSSEVIRTIVSRSEGRGIQLDEMRKRVKILDKLDAATERLDVEDDQHELLCRIVKDFPFGAAERELIQVCDDILDARDPDAAKVTGL